LLLVALGSSGVAVAAYAAHVLRRLEDSTVDLRFRVRGTEKPNGGIVIVKVDDKTFQDLNMQWPFPRAVHARLLARIEAERPAAIVYDVQFSEPSQHGQRDDLALLQAISGARHRIVFAITETDARGNFRFLGSDEGRKLLREVGSRGASGLFPFDAGGEIRHVTTSAGGLDSIAVATAEIASSGRLDPPAGTSQWIDFRGPDGTFPSVSFSDALRGNLPPTFFTGRIAVIGVTAPSLQDVHPTSTDGQMSGPEIEANAIDSALRRWPLHSVPGSAALLAIVVLGGAVPLSSLRLGPVAATLVGAAVGVAFTVGAQVAFAGGEVATFGYPMVALALSGTGSLAVQLMTEAFERARVRDLFARFVPADVVDEVLRSASGLRLGGVEREGTVMFTDLRGFTAMAEPLTPTTVINVLNRYLAEMSDAILDHGGTLVAYMGDGIMAVFGAPLPQADHADRAVATAREMLDVRLPRFNDWLRCQQLGDGLEMGIGINSGSIMSGHVGSERRVEYAAVGDTTNTASRIEALSKDTPQMLLLSEATRHALVEPPDDLEFVTEAGIRGRVARIRLWTIGDGRLRSP
jgi:adenylate cyclase